MSTGAERSYDESQKRHYRRTAWNAIRDRLYVPVKDAVVLYLAGARDEDREVALDKGFRAENLIALERDRRALESLRNLRVNTINASVFEVVYSWWGQDVHAVHFDLCCGFTQEVRDIVAILSFMPSFPAAVLSFNLLRGRESDLLPEYKGRHRGELAHHRNREFAHDFVNEQAEAQGRLMGQWMGDSRLLSGCYNSSCGQVFDWAIWRNCHIWNSYFFLGLRHDADAQVDFLKRMGLQFGAGSIPKSRAPKGYIDTSAIVRRIAAARAVRTMRMQASA